ncbi:MAG: hypothetical protein QG670_75 [Thermoproteota archaeon]|nr:hypothetical protein [Thermoproteota archaeon]
MSSDNVLSFTSRDEWRSWLEKNHSTEDEIWVYILRKHSNEVGLMLEEAVDEAICYGWIDSKMKSLNGDKFVLRFCKRKPNSYWSKINRNRAEKMIESGRMSEAGLASVEAAKKTGIWYNVYTSKVSPTVPKDLAEALRLNPPSMDNFTSLSNTAKLQLIAWVEEAKKPETRKKRINEYVKKSIT